MILQTLLNPTHIRKQLTVMAVDVSINALFNHISETRVSAHGTAFLFNGDASVYHPLNRETPGDKRFSSLHTQVADPHVRDAMAAWHARGKPRKAFMFPSEDQTKWAGVQPINGDNHEFWIGVVVPQSDFLNKVQEKRWALLVVILGVFALGLLVAGYVVQKHPFIYNLSLLTIYPG